MDVEKFRNLTDAELQHQQRELNDQLFRLKFQLKMGQTESLNKIRGLRKDVARIHTVIREKQLGIEHHRAAAAATPAPAEGAATATVAKKAAHAKSSGRSKAKSAKKSTGKTKAKARKR
jgi:large subunit ribosomal protein L29